MYVSECVCIVLCVGGKGSVGCSKTGYPIAKAAWLQLVLAVRLVLGANVTRFELLKRNSKSDGGVCTGMHACVCMGVSPNFLILTQNYIYFLTSEKTIINMQFITSDL